MVIHGPSDHANASAVRRVARPSAVTKVKPHGASSRVGVGSATAISVHHVALPVSGLKAPTSMALRCDGVARAASQPVSSRIRTNVAFHCQSDTHSGEQ